MIEIVLHTKRGSAIRRYKNNVGKAMGSCIYVHTQYVNEVIPTRILEKSKTLLTRLYPNFNFNTICFDVKAQIVRFDESPDFDTAREPHVGNYISVYVDENKPPQMGQSNNIWHHKWLWVKDDYNGFDVNASKEWSRIWLSKLDEPAKGTDITWNLQLQKYGLKVY